MDQYAKQALLEYNSEECSPHPGGVNGRAFWNTNASQFMFAPVLQFPKVPKARAYLYTAEDQNGLVLVQRVRFIDYIIHGGH